MNLSYATKEELRALLSTARGARDRDWLMILMAYLHGLRASEVIKLTVDNVKDGYLTVQRLKGPLFPKWQAEGKNPSPKMQANAN